MAKRKTPSFRETINAAAQEIAEAEKIEMVTVELSNGWKLIKPKYNWRHKKEMANA